MHHALLLVDKEAEGSNANAGSRTPCSNLQPNSMGAKVRTSFQGSDQDLLLVWRELLVCIHGPNHHTRERERSVAASSMFGLPPAGANDRSEAAATTFIR